MFKPLSQMQYSRYLPTPLIGVDEVGRGCLAGPVVAAAVTINNLKKKWRYTDSKLLSERRRSELFDEILGLHRVGIGFASNEEIDAFNIHHASLLAMRRAVLSLKVESGHLLVDGCHTIGDLPGFGQTALIKGDLRAIPISAASIVAKVYRDRWMTNMAGTHRGYDFEIHKGYPTAKHLQALQLQGPCAIHRRTFKGVKEHFFENSNWQTK